MLDIKKLEKFFKRCQTVHVAGFCPFLLLKAGTELGVLAKYLSPVFNLLHLAFTQIRAKVSKQMLFSRKTNLFQNCKLFLEKLPEIILKTCPRHLPPFGRILVKL